MKSVLALLVVLVTSTIIHAQTPSLIRGSDIISEYGNYLFSYNYDNYDARARNGKDIASIYTGKGRRYNMFSPFITILQVCADRFNDEFDGSEFQLPGHAFKRCRDWALPYQTIFPQSSSKGPGLVRWPPFTSLHTYPFSAQSLEIGDTLESGDIAITIEAIGLNGESTTCTVLYGFTGSGALKPTLTDNGCIE